MADAWSDYQANRGLLSGPGLNPYGMDPERVRQLTGLLAPPVQAPGLGVPGGLLGGRMAQNAAAGAVDAAMLPGDAYQGNVDLSSPQGFARIQNMAGLLAQSGLPMAEGGSLGMAGGRPYSNAPDSLMGFRRNGPQRAFDETNYTYELPVKVRFSNTGDVFEDAIMGLNKPHALERARRNWPGAEIEPLN